MKKRIAFIFMSAALSCWAGTMTDSRDGMEYETVKIGKQVWMAQNLTFETENSWCYNDVAGSCITNGRLYAWKSAMNACPAGWHLPTQKEVTTLMKAQKGACVTEKELKSKSGKGGMAILFTGMRNTSGKYVAMDETSFFWTSTDLDGIPLDWECDFESNSGGIGSEMNANFGMSVRCIKDK